MMNEYTYNRQQSGFSERNRRMGRNTDRMPYRCPSGHSTMSDRGSYPFGRQTNGCGCGAVRGAQTHNHNTHRNNTPRCGNRNHVCGDENNQTARVLSNVGCGCGCGQNNGTRTECGRLMDQIRAVDFALYETVLYLDVYPHSCDAMETYHKLKAQSEALHKEYEQAHGPLTAFGNQSQNSWDWMSKPFPWESDAE